jgi:flavin-binding protein dodecin
VPGTTTHRSKGSSKDGFSQAAQAAIDQTPGKAKSFTVVELAGEVSANPGKINTYSVTLEVTVET